MDIALLICYKIKVTREKSTAVDNLPRRLPLGQRPVPVLGRRERAPRRQDRLLHGHAQGGSMWIEQILTEQCKN